MNVLLAQVEIRKRTGEGCVQENGFCPDWIADNFDRYVDPFWQHVYLTTVSVAIGFAIAFGLALLAHRRRWLIGPIVGFTGVLYTIPSIAAFLLLLPLTGRGDTTAIIALVSYTLLIIFRNITTGLDNVPDEMKDAGRGMGLTDRQLLWRVELPLAWPVLLAGIRTAAVVNVGTAALATFVGAGGLGELITVGLDNQRDRILYTGAALTALLALAVDWALGAVAAFTTSGRRS